VDLLPPADPWASYARTVVGIVRRGTANLVVEAAPPDHAGVWPWPTEPAVHVLTAWDPGDVRPSEAENRAHQAALEAELRELSPDEVWSAVGVDPMSGHREEGVAVRGLALDAVRDLAARYRQVAIFQWTPATWAIVGCRDGRRVDFGWTASEA